jgi:SNF2 family DNA or RNA helicase
VKPGTPFFARVGERLILLGDTSIQQFACILNSGGKRTERGWEWSWSQVELIHANCPELRPLIDSAFSSYDECGDLTKPLSDGKVLRAHQVSGVRRIVHAERIILADDMGLGKCLTSLVSSRILSKKHRCQVIVIAPVSMMDEWLHFAKVVGVNITTFSWSKLPEPPEEPYILVADEAHFSGGGSSTIRGRAFAKLTEAKQCLSAILLTGTPIKNARPRNIYPLLRAVKAPVARKKTDFEFRFCDAKRTRFCRWDTTGATNLDELHQLSAPYILRRTKKECLDLPKLTRVMVKADVKSDEERSYQTSLGHIREQWQCSSRDAISSRGAIDKANGAASLTKVPHAIQLVEQIIESGHKAVVFSQFLEPVRLVALGFGDSALVLTGDTPQVARKPLTDRFQSDHKIKVWVSTGQAGGVGLTLTAACYVIIIDRPWTPGDVVQQESRIDRMGQTLPCTSYWIRYGLVDESRDDALAAKAVNIQAALGDAEVGIDSISAYDQMDFKLMARKLFSPQYGKLI